MDLKIYTNTGCGYCSKAKELCKRANVEYTEVRLGRDITSEEFQERFPGNGFPQFTIDDIPIGGLVDAVKWFVDAGMISRETK